jgi:hypothetical protein
VTLYLRVDREVYTVRGLFEVLSLKIGIVMLLLEVVHFCNVYVFDTIRRRSRMETLRTLPVQPQGCLPQPYPAPQGR